MNQKNKKEFRRLIKKARKLDNEFIKSDFPLNMRLHVSMDVYQRKNKKFKQVTNNLFRTRLNNFILEMPDIITIRHIGFKRWRRKIEESESINIEDLIKENYENERLDRQ